MIFAAAATATASDPITMSAPSSLTGLPLSRNGIGSRCRVTRSACPVPPGGDVQTSARHHRSNESDEGGRPIRLGRGGGTEHANDHDLCSCDEERPTQIRRSGLRHRWSPPPYVHSVLDRYRFDGTPQGSKVPPKRGPPPGLLCPPAFRPRRDFAPIPMPTRSGASLGRRRHLGPAAASYSPRAPDPWVNRPGWRCPPCDRPSRGRC